MSNSNLLVDPILSLQVEGEPQEGALPEALAVLAAADQVGFTRLAAHQRQSWYCFLVQLAAIALHRSGETAPSTDPDHWRVLLRALTAQHADDAPWRLVVDDLRQPAFLQPPFQRGRCTDFRTRFDTPDDLDVLVTAKNHDIKQARLAAAAPEQWVYALVNLQTLQGYLGAGNHGIARMNGGFASRAFVGRAPAPHWGPRFRRDVRVLLDKRDRIIDRIPDYRQSGGLALVWLAPWDDEEPLALARLDPYFIEVCRRVRMTADPGGLAALYRTSRTPRLAAKQLNGMLGDPWSPTDRNRGAALTVAAGGFDYRLLARVLFRRDYEPGLALEPHPADPDGDILVMATVLVRGQGRTDGLHERLIPVPAVARSNFDLLFDDEDKRKTLGDLAEDRIKAAGEVRRRVLRPALLTLLQGAPARLDLQDNRAAGWLDQFDRRVDEVFFDHLWQAVGRAAEPEPETDPYLDWCRTLGDIGRRLLDRAEAAMAIPAARRWRALAQAERVFIGALYNTFPELRPPTRPATEEAA